MKAESLEENAARLWKLVREEIDGDPVAVQDRQRLDEVLAEKRARSQAFFRTTAGQWDRLRDELFGTRFDLLALAGLLDDGWVVGDLACGTGRTAWALAPFVRKVLAVDESQEMLDAAAHRLASLGNVAIRPGKLEALPLEAGSLDAAILSLALHHVPEPSLALGEIRRTLKPGARLLLVDMMPHHREELRQEMGHVWLGFDESQVETYLGTAGFQQIRYRPLSTPSESSGLGLFVATARAATDISKRTRTRLNPGG
jgi:ArsR family transcriptional regulator